MTQASLSFVTGADLRDAGMHAALSHAERVDDDWPAQAMWALREYIRRHPGAEFMTEAVRVYAYNRLNVPQPPHCRAWGSIIRKASREGLIRFVRLAPVKTASSHMANASVWRAA